MDDISYNKLLQCSNLPGTRIGIGQYNDLPIITEGIIKSIDSGLQSIEPFFNIKDLLHSLKTGKIDAAIRGNLPASDFIYEVKKTFNIDVIHRIVLMQTSSQKMFILAPVGIDEGSSIDSKIEIIKNCIEFLHLFEVEATIGILSGGREEDFGRNKRIDTTIKEAELITDKIRSLGFNCSNFGILIEDAIKKSNVIIVPDGIIGNFIFRTLYHLGDGDSIGAPIVNISKTIIDTSRTKKDYTSSIILAAALFNTRKLKSP